VRTEDASAGGTKDAVSVPVEPRMHGDWDCPRLGEDQKLAKGN